MICIYCFHKDTRITNSRGHLTEASTWRRHNCPQCGRAYSSIERPVMADSYRITDESAGTDDPYSRTRISASLLAAFGHLSGTERYVAVDWLVETTEKALIANAYYGALSKDELGMYVYDILKKYDPVAGVQYAAQNGLVSAISKRKRGRPSLK